MCSKAKPYSQFVQFSASRFLEVQRLEQPATEITKRLRGEKGQEIREDKKKKAEQ
jgi:hypothetical protein